MIRFIAPRLHRCRQFLIPTAMSIQTSPRAGGCTFPEDPARSCALVMPFWSASFDPRVLPARALQPQGAGPRLFDARSPNILSLRRSNCEHLLVDRGNEPIRLDIIEGTVTNGPVTLHFDLADDDALDGRLAALEALRHPRLVEHRYHWLARRLLALHAFDAREANASLREIADIVLGCGDWPGDGEHRKSLVRRLVVTGTAMVRAGARAILALR